jgi:putative peptidoglycan lipid II flippase
VAASQTAQWRTEQSVAQGQVLLMVGGFSLLLGLCARWWLPVFFPGLSTQQASAAETMTQILLGGAVLNAHASLYTAALRARDRFILPELVAAAAGVLAVAAAAVVVPSFGLVGAAWVSASRAGAVCLVLFVASGCPGPAVAAAAFDRQAWAKVRPLLAGSAIYKCSPIVDRYWGSQTSSGGLTLLTLSQAGMGALAQMLERAVCVPVTPRLARMVQAGEYEALRALVRRTIGRVTILAGLLAVVLVVAYPWWPAALHHAFRMQEPAAREMWWVCLLLLGFLHVTASGGVPVAAFYALGDTRTPVKISVAAFVIGVGLKSLAFVVWGLPGLAFATSIYYIGNLLVVCAVLENRLDARSACNH